MNYKVTREDIFGFLRPNIDAHTLGVSTIAKLLSDCGYQVVIADASIAEAVADIAKIGNISLLKRWILDYNIAHIGFSYRLDPIDAQRHFGKMFALLKDHNIFIDNDGPVKNVFFAGLPEACKRITMEYQGKVQVFIGDETPLESLRKMGIPDNRIPREISNASAYDEELLEFGRKQLESGTYLSQEPIDRSGYKTFGTFQDKVVDRIEYSQRKNLLPLTRVHTGPYNPNYHEALNEFNSWLVQLAQSGFLDIVSIGSSQLSQSDFGTDWKNKPNGGGVPINSREDLVRIWNVSRPMLVRTYAGTQNIPQLAKIYESTINIAWHALSFWWFCQIDGRGPYSVKKNLEEHLETLKLIAQTGKPFEPNIPHHFGFRGSDDFTYVLSGYLAAKTAKKLNVRYMILQTMLNTPKYTWGIQDLAKSRALLRLVKELEDKRFKVYHQPRAGLDYFSPNLEKAKIQLAAVSAMMDDIDPLNHLSPSIIHVVSYSEAVHLATPKIINESIQITLQAIHDYRRLRKENKVENMAFHGETLLRTEELYQEVKEVVTLIEKHYPDPYSAEGLYNIFKDGIMPVPYLWEGRDEFKKAVSWKTSLVKGSIKVIDDNNRPVDSFRRVKNILEEVNNQ